jgi:hypothetical protein
MVETAHSSTRPPTPLDRLGAALRKGLCAAALACLLAAAPAPAHTIDTGRAADAVREAAESLGPVDQAKCWRPVIGARRARNRAVCAAWWVHRVAGGSCTLLYEVRMARPPSRRLVVIQTFQPWCAGLPAIPAAPAPATTERQAR